MINCLFNGACAAGLTARDVQARLVLSDLNSHTFPLERDLIGPLCSNEHSHREPSQLEVARVSAVCSVLKDLEGWQPSAVTDQDHGKEDLFFLLYVCSACVYMCVRERSTAGVFPSHSPPYNLSQGLTLNPEIKDETKPASQKTESHSALGVCHYRCGELWIRSQILRLVQPRLICSPNPGTGQRSVSISCLLALKNGSLSGVPS